RPQSSKWSSTLGYARLNSPYNVVDRPLKPRYEPRESFERKLLASGYAGCEDPRLTRIGNDIFMCYTAFDSVNSPRVALTHIAQSDFLIQHWSAWSRPKLISAPGVMNKNTLIFPEQAGGKIIMLHRIDPNIYIEKYTEAEFASLGETHFLEPKTCLLVGSVTGREPKSVPIARRTDRHPDGYYFIMGSTDGILNID
ncbi:MAG: hypothetical protein NTV34_13950, partial [Proteobacteria bacterium]|nr:hypothetical protein [Pseudomonadota bacterium]